MKVANARMMIPLANFLDRVRPRLGIGDNQMLTALMESEREGWNRELQRDEIPFNRCASA
jgi:hypothetical protein